MQTCFRLFVKVFEALVCRAVCQIGDVACGCVAKESPSTPVLDIADIRFKPGPLAPQPKLFIILLVWVEACVAVPPPPPRVADGAIAPWRVWVPFLKERLLALLLKNHSCIHATDRWPCNLSHSSCQRPTFASRRSTPMQIQHEKHSWSQWLSHWHFAAF